MEKRKPLVLAQTKALVDSLISSSRLSSQASQNGAKISSSSDDTTLYLELLAGILRISNEKMEVSESKIRSLDHSALVGLSTSVLKRLSTASGSLVLVKNVDTNIQRIAQAVVLDPPVAREQSFDANVGSSNNPYAMPIFPCYTFPQTYNELLDEAIAYVSPQLAFNIGMHTSCLISLIGHGKGALASLFGVQEDKETNRKEKVSAVNVRLETLPYWPRYASHLRVSFVKIPECGTIESLKKVLN
ncbi:hypothetical protein Nepgr_004480 [Nepenthes gracilis]|uniref:Uncharacterized protein n=1 Tax=Nepenthes gracilis TaxID=150966 RepID=A0AAD3XFF7_NEPGR|nr:hypothetical protein Nepgr_004480 [Nepenthes gracilis]